MGITVTTEAVEAELKKLEGSTQENPKTEITTTMGLKTSGCVYTTENGEHCLAATLILNLGGQVPQYDHPNNVHSIAHLCGYVEGMDDDVWKSIFGIDEITPAATRMLQRAQSYADQGYHWGLATTLTLRDERQYHSVDS